MNRPKIAISINTSWNFINFRSGLLRALLAHDYDVLAVSPVDDYTEKLTRMGVEHASLKIDPSSLSPFDAMGLTFSYLRLFRRHRPHIYLSYTPKPNVFGSLAAHLLGIPVINNIAGLGRAFARPGPLRHVAGGLFKLALGRSRVVFFQNEQDRRYFIERRVVREERARLLPGSGVDLTRFAPLEPSLASRETCVFLLVARLLKAKGIAEFAEAARRLKPSYPHARFRIVGIEQNGDDAVSTQELAAWSDEGIIERRPATDDIREHLGQADCVVLPSRYPEGTPRILLEAAAMAKPLIATDIPGCRDVALDGTTGLLCAKGDVESLVRAIRRMLDLTPDEREAMGRAARLHVEANYDEKLVIDAYLAAIGAHLS